ncbi:MAG: SpoIIIAH-like family protein [Firmicutes bacterium]|nr:SpoIIIAH-like family protein [Bacillota bacterium]
MFIIKRNQVIITALVVMIAAAGYLNYIDTQPTENDTLMNDEGDLTGVLAENGEIPVFDENSEIAVNEENIAQEANAEGGEEQVADAQEETPAGEAVFVNSSNDSSYFIQAKLDREQARAKEKDILTEMINNANIDAEKKAECADSMLKIQQRIEKETAAEAMIESKGFQEVYVRIDDETVDVVVNKEKLSEAEIAQIEDIVKRKTGYSTDKIRISPMKKQ